MSLADGWFLSPLEPGSLFGWSESKLSLWHTSQVPGGAGQACQERTSASTVRNQPGLEPAAW